MVIRLTPYKRSRQVCNNSTRTSALLLLDCNQWIVLRRVIRRLPWPKQLQAVAYSRTFKWPYGILVTMDQQPSASPVQRVRIWYALLLVVFGLFSVRVFYLQVIRHD